MGLTSLEKKDLDRNALLASGVCHALAKISSRRTDNLLPWIQTTNQEIGSSSFKAANRIRRFHLHDRAPPQRSTQLLVDELRSITEDRVDYACGPFDIG